jgi:hypothetical protein
MAQSTVLYMQAWSNLYCAVSFCFFYRSFNKILYAQPDTLVRQRKISLNTT